MLLTNEADELFAGIAVTDFYAVYRYMEGLDHQNCWPHLVRDARKLLDIDGGPLTERFLSMLVSIYHDGKRAQESEDAGQRHGIRVRLGPVVVGGQTRSERGSRTMADMMSMAQTARKQSVPLGPFIAQALDAHCRGLAPPSLFAER